MRTSLMAVTLALTSACPAAVPTHALLQHSPDMLPGGHAYHTFDLQYLGRPGLNWVGSSARFELLDPALSFYQAQGGDAIAQLMPPKPSEVASDPALAWDTFVTTPFGFPNITDDGLRQPPFLFPLSARGSILSDPALIELVWATATPDAPVAPYTIARFTIQGPEGLALTLENTGLLVGFIHGLTSTAPGISDNLIYAFGIYVVPEPAGWIGLIGLALVLRRR